jgi:hypothetical protein
VGFTNSHFFTALAPFISGIQTAAHCLHTISYTSHSFRQNRQCLMYKAWIGGAFKSVLTTAVSQENSGLNCCVFPYTALFILAEIEQTSTSTFPLCIYRSSAVEYFQSRITSDYAFYNALQTNGIPRIFFRGFSRGSTSSVEDRGQRERGSGGGSPLVRCSIQFANQWNPYSY